MEIVKTIIRHIKDKYDNNVGEHMIRHVVDRKGHDKRYAIDASRISRELGWHPETSFHDGIRKTIDWYYENKSWLYNVSSDEYKNYYNIIYGKI